MTIVELCVHMDCAGCEARVRKALGRLKGVDSVDVDMARQKVTVTGWADQKKVLKAARKTGRRAVLWPYTNDPAQADLYYQNNPQAAAGGGATGPYLHHPALGPGASSSYNYYKHGYDSATSYQRQCGGSRAVDDRARSMFSDDNPNACSIM